MNNYNLNQIPSEAQLKKLLRKAIFGKYLHCPHCGSRKVKPSENRYRCKKCRQKFSLISESWLRGTKIPLPKICLLLWCWQIKIPLDQAKAVAVVSLPTVRHWYDKFRGHLPLQKLDDLRLEGAVQGDECYRRDYSIIGAKQEAAAGQKTKMALTVLFKNSVDKSDAVNFLSRKVKPESIFRTDGAGIYKKIENWWPVTHEFEIHKKFEFAITSEIEGLWGNFFTFVRRMYHHITVAKVEAIVNEFCFRQCFEEYFYSPEKYLALCLVKLQRKNPRKFLPPQKPKFPFIFAQDLPAFVPSCF